MNPKGDPSQTILFAQVNSFSYTNDALAAALQPHLAGCQLEIFRVYPVIRGNPILFGLCLLAVVYFYGLRAAFDRKTVTEKIVKTPLFFRMAGWLVRRRAARLANLSSVLQTQGLFNAKVAGVPLIVYTDNTILNPMNTVLDSAAPTSPILALERELYQEADSILVSASHVLASLVEDYGRTVGSDRNVLIGANSPAVPSVDNRRYEAGRILFVGIDWERKGGPTLLKAFEAVSQLRPEAELIIVGCNPPFTPSKRIDVRGKVAPREVARLMGEASIFCLPSRVEPSSVAVVEAAKARLPVVATTVGGMMESVVDGETGFLVPPDDAAALATALVALLSDASLCERMGRAGQEWSRRFDWTVVAGKVSEEIKREMAAQADRNLRSRSA